MHKLGLNIIKTYMNSWKSIKVSIINEMPVEIFISLVYLCFGKPINCILNILSGCLDNFYVKLIFSEFYFGANFYLPKSIVVMSLNFSGAVCLHVCRVSFTSSVEEVSFTTHDYADCYN